LHSWSEEKSALWQETSAGRREITEPTA